MDRWLATAQHRWSSRRNARGEHAKTASQTTQSSETANSRASIGLVVGGSSTKKKKHGNENQMCV